MVRELVMIPILLFFIWQCITMHTEIKELKGENQRMLKSYNTLLEERDRLQKEKEKSDAELQSALSANKDWGSAPVPDLVQRAFAGLLQPPVDASLSGTYKH